MKEQIILVDENDDQIGEAEKLRAHKAGLLHRAFSVFIFNAKGELILQKRATSKYHSGGLWSNSCCGHPRPGEITKSAAERRLGEEMGFFTKLKEVLVFSYSVELGNGLVENEIDHVFFGDYDGRVSPDTNEAEDWKWINIRDLENDLQNYPDSYTYWLKSVFPKVKNLR